MHIVHPAVEKQASIAPRIPERKAVLKFITNPPIMTMLAIVMMMMMTITTIAMISETTHWAEFFQFHEESHATVVLLVSE